MIWLSQDLGLCQLQTWGGQFKHNSSSSNNSNGLWKCWDGGVGLSGSEITSSGPSLPFLPCLFLFGPQSPLFLPMAELWMLGTIISDQTCLFLLWSPREEHWSTWIRSHVCSLANYRARGTECSCWPVLVTKLRSQVPGPMISGPTRIAPCGEGANRHQRPTAFKSYYVIILQWRYWSTDCPLLSCSTEIFLDLTYWKLMFLTTVPYGFLSSYLGDIYDSLW